jgi:hypothetical protein
VSAWPAPLGSVTRSDAYWDNGQQGNSPKNSKCRRLTAIKQTLRQGAMISQLEFSSRAALCRRLAKQEPTNRALWMAEAENWLRLSKERLRGETRTTIGPGFLASLRPRRARYLSISVSAIVRKFGMRRELVLILVFGMQTFIHLLAPWAQFGL